MFKIRILITAALLITAFLVITSSFADLSSANPNSFLAYLPAIYNQEPTPAPPLDTTLPNLKPAGDPEQSGWPMQSGFVLRNSMSGPNTGVPREGATWIVYSAHNQGPGYTGSEFGMRVLIDKAIAAQVICADLSVNETCTSSASLGDVIGGVHTVTLQIDPANSIAEWDEGDNIVSRQISWISNTPTPSPTATPVPPLISSITPTTAKPGDAITINGSNFGATQSSVGGTVSIGGLIATIQVWSPSLIVARIPAYVTPGTVSVAVVAAGSSSNAFSYTVSPPSTATPTPVPVPLITNVSPANSAARGDLVTITGTNFGSSQSAVNGNVTIGGVVASPLIWADGAITVVVPQSATVGAGSIVVVARGISSLPFAYIIT